MRFGTLLFSAIAIQTQRPRAVNNKKSHGRHTDSEFVQRIPTLMRTRIRCFVPLNDGTEGRTCLPGHLLLMQVIGYVGIYSHVYIMYMLIP